MYILYLKSANCPCKTAKSISLTLTQLIVPSYRTLDHFIRYEMTYQNQAYVNKETDEVNCLCSAVGCSVAIKFLISVNKIDIWNNTRFIIIFSVSHKLMSGFLITCSSRQISIKCIVEINLVMRIPYPRISVARKLIKRNDKYN